MQLTHTFDVNEEQLEQLKLLQKAMRNYSKKQGSDLNEYYTIERVFDFVMELGQNHMISDRIENAAWHYCEEYDEGTYPYEYGKGMD